MAVQNLKTYLLRIKSSPRTTKPVFGLNDTWRKLLTSSVETIRARLSPPFLSLSLSLSRFLSCGETPVDRRKIDMEWWDQIRRVCNGVALRFKIRKSGLLKLQHDVRDCGYDDVRVMWEMLQRNQTKNARPSGTRKKTAIWSCFGWARRCTPYIGRGF